jgi:mannosyl-oligosaccharide alpha-1,2-mannosidase
LGGLLSAYELTDGDQLYLDRAVDLADRMLAVFDSPSGLPYSQVNLAQRVGVADPDNRGLVSTAEASTLQLEFRYLGFLTDNFDYWDKAEHVRACFIYFFAIDVRANKLNRLQVMKVIRQARLPDGLTPIFMRCAFT